MATLTIFNGVQIFIMTGRNAQGVRLIGLGDGEHLQAMAPVVSESQEEAAENVEV